MRRIVYKTIGLTGLLLPLLTTGCISRTHYPYQPYQIHQVALTERASLDLFGYDTSKSLTISEKTDEGETRGYRVTRFSLPSVGDNGEPTNLVTVTYYQSKKAGTKSLVILLPVWGIHTYPSYTMTGHILKHSGGEFNVLRVEGDYQLIDWERLRSSSDEAAFKAGVANSAERVRNTVIDIRRLTDWAEQQPEINAHRIALTGFSISAFVAALALQAEPRFAAGVVAMGAANPALVVANCAGTEVEVKEVLLERFGWTSEYYQSVVHQYFWKLDPKLYLGRVDASRILMIDALYDECMPRSARDALWEVLGRPERVTLKYKHKMAFLSMTPLGFNYMRHKIYHFLEQTLQNGAQDYAVQ